MLYCNRCRRAPWSPTLQWEKNRRVWLLGILIPFRVRLLGVLTKESQTTQKAGHRWVNLPWSLCRLKIFESNQVKPFTWEQWACLFPITDDKYCTWTQDSKIDWQSLNCWIHEILWHTFFQVIKLYNIQFKHTFAKISFAIGQSTMIKRMRKAIPTFE